MILNNQGAEYNNPVIETNEKTWDVFNKQLAYGPYARMVISLPTNNNTANIPFYPIRLVQGNTEDTTDPNYNEFNPDIHVVLKVYVVTAFGYGIITPFKKEDSELQFWTRSKDPDKNKDTLIQLYNCVFLQGVIITCQLNLKNLIFLFII
ncbi:unnamed protein product [Rhizophagus irregularis]|uniref:Uncharacterized protein n=1 Tax=Rhizophagus irregularis TaxID=588596 RepID=A0A915Z2F0_9GLOM|nr:unnamed protein product [Rhizophagus irregularis]